MTFKNVLGQNLSKAIGVTAAFPVFFFPDTFPKTQAIMAQREAERVAWAGHPDQNGGFVSDLKAILTNRIWLYACFGLIADNFFISAAISYINKFQENAFFISAATAGAGSAFMIVGGVFGAVLALLMNQKFSWKISTSLFWSSMTGLVCIIAWSTTTLLLVCPSSKIELNTDCAADCGCTDAGYAPICDR